MSIRSLEAERHSILDRMRVRRETYRRMLTEGLDVEQAEMRQVGNPPATYTYHPVSSHFPRSTLMRVISEHPFLCALGVAVIVAAIGPRRIARTVASGGAAMGALTTRSQSNIDMIGRLLTLAGAYARGRRKSRPQQGRKAG